MVLTHRLAYELKHGPIPEGKQVLHKCDNPPCCNEAHLRLGTNDDNVVDRTVKDRSAKGEAHPRSKLTAADMLEIQRRLAAGELQRVIAADFGISGQHVSRIKIGKNNA